MPSGKRGARQGGWGGGEGVEKREGRGLSRPRAGLGGHVCTWRRVHSSEVNSEERVRCLVLTRTQPHVGRGRKEDETEGEAGQGGGGGRARPYQAPSLMQGGPTG